MIDTASLIGFGGASLAIALSPGASWMYLISNAASQGPQGGRAAIAGNATGILGHTALATVGLSTVVAYSSDVYAIVRWLGALYLMFLAVRTIRSPSPFTQSALPTQQTSWWVIYRGGVVMNLLNPKVALLMVALLPQFISPVASSVVTHTLILGSLHAIIATCVLLVIARLTTAAAPILYESPRLERLFRWTSGAVLLGLGARTALASPPA